jgi:16S rRNA (uracil1498-N3)-methyltransferase
MRIPRFYVREGLAAGARIALPPGVARHAVRVLRMREGDAVVLFDGSGGQWRGRLDTIAGDQVWARLEAHETSEKESPLSIALAQGISGGERMDYTLQKAVELGVSAIQPLGTLRSVVRLDARRAERKIAHWRQLVAAACEQCGRNHVPPVAEVTDLPHWLAQMTDVPRLLLDPDAGVRLSELPRPEGKIVLLAGPEGGFDDREREAALAAGFTGVRLGPRVLRTETAALAALAAMQTLWGDF